MLLLSIVFLPVLGMLLCLVAPARAAKQVNVLTNAVVLALVCVLWSRAESWSDSTTTAAEPMKEPCGWSMSKSSGMSSIVAGNRPADGPPGW